MHLQTFLSKPPLCLPLSNCPISQPTQQPTNPEMDPFTVSSVFKSLLLRVSDRSHGDIYCRCDDEEHTAFSLILLYFLGKHLLDLSCSVMTMLTANATHYKACTILAFIQNT